MQTSSREGPGELDIGSSPLLPFPTSSSELGRPQECQHPGESGCGHTQVLSVRPLAPTDLSKKSLLACVIGEVKRKLQARLDLGAEA
jgi:hypothetical protein